MPKINQNDLLKNILQGIKSGHHKYKFMSGIDQFYRAPEYFLTCQIADAIRMTENCTVSLEENIKGVVDEAAIKAVGNVRKGLRKDGRADITVRWNGNPFAIIEVKHPLYSVTKDFRKDIERIRDLLHTNGRTDGSFELGALAYWIGSDAPKNRDASPKERIERKANELKRKAEELVNNNCKVEMKIEIQVEEDNWAWGAGVLVLRPC